MAAEIYKSANRQPDFIVVWMGHTFLSRRARNFDGTPRSFHGTQSMLDELPTQSRVGMTKVGGIDLNKPRTRWVVEAVIALCLSARQADINQPLADSRRWLRWWFSETKRSSLC
jgi:hypothetical protein